MSSPATLPKSLNYRFPVPPAYTLSTQPSPQPCLQDGQVQVEYKLYAVDEIMVQSLTQNQVLLPAFLVTRACT